MRGPLQLAFQMGKLNRRFIPLLLCRQGQQLGSRMHLQLGGTSASDLERGGSHGGRGLTLTWVGRTLGLTLLDAPFHKRYRLAFDVRLARVKSQSQLCKRLEQPLEAQFQFMYDQRFMRTTYWLSEGYTLELGAWGETTPHALAF